MGRRASKVDRNHTEIVETLRKLGWSVRSLAACGKGIPDLLLGKHGWTTIAEVKDGLRPPSQRKLTEDQEKFWSEWKGSIILLQSVADAIELNKKRSGSLQKA